LGRRNDIAFVRDDNGLKAGEAAALLPDGDRAGRERQLRVMDGDQLDPPAVSIEDAIEGGKALEAVRNVDRLRDIALNGSGLRR